MTTAHLGPEAPDEHRTGDALHEAVDAEAEQGDAASHQGGRDCHGALDEVPSDSQVLESEAATQQCSTRGDRHHAHATVEAPESTTSSPT